MLELRIDRSLLLLICGLSVLAASTPTLAQATFSDQSVAILGGFSVDARSASMADIDNDGDLDLFFQGLVGARQMLRNNIIGTGAMTYTNITPSMNLTGLGDSWSAAWGDYNGDGRVDVFVGQTNATGSGDVLRNNGPSGFTNTSNATGLDDPGFHQNVAWADIDRDRDLDLIIGMEGPSEKHEIYLQGNNGTFTPVGTLVGFQAPFGTKSYGMAIGDTDGDGDLDIYISTCNGSNSIRNNFFVNQLAETGTLGFIDIADTNGTQFGKNSYGAEFHDFDNDGRLDLFMTGADTEPSKIWRNDGNNMFTDVDTITGHPLLTSTGTDFNGSRAVDYDNDGDLDLFFHDHLGNQRTGDFARKLYRNDGNWQFTDVTTQEGLHSASLGAYDSVWGDIDLDGDQDLIAPTGGSTIPEKAFISNASTNGNHWLYLRLEGPTDNTTGLGASVFATLNAGTPEEVTLRREANTNAGTFNQSDLPVHFGLGDVDLIDELCVQWPDGTVQIIHDVSADQYLTIHTPGDFDGDRDVDGADLVQWNGDFGDNALSDSDMDGDSDGTDFLRWQQQVGNGGSGAAVASAAVPEPGSVALMAAMAVVLGFRGYARTRQ